MKKIILLVTACYFGIHTAATAQDLGKKANLNEDGTISVETVILPENYNNAQKQPADLLFSFSRPAHPNFKNSRGVTLADLDNDGTDEILYGIYNTLFALKGDGSILWEKPVSGTILLPPTAIDMDNDGTVEIVLNTGGVPNAGRVYLMDNLGNDLTGWPLNFSEHWMLNAPAVADVDDDGNLDIITGERVGSAQGFVHALKMDGTPINANWPVEIAATPAFTPSIADVDNDGNTDVVIAASSAGMYIFDNQGQAFPGFPVFDASVNYSYQSPILVDLDGDDDLEIVGSNHGNSPGFYVMEHDGNYKSGWPIATSEWTYSPPTVLDVDKDGTYEIFMADRNTAGNGDPLPTIYGLTPEGTNLQGFPISKYGGNEGVLTIGDVNNDGIMDIVFTSVITDASGIGYIHAYSMDGSGEIDGFPLRPEGFTFLNAAVLGDVDGDGLLDLTANSYTLTFGSGTDMAFVNVYNLDVPYNPETILRNGYKGDNSRDGYVKDEIAIGITENTLLNSININPNPSDGILNISVDTPMEKAVITIYSIDGKKVFSEESSLSENTATSYNLKHLNSGLYLVNISNGKHTSTAKWVKN